jgi:hypothetical protein
MELDRDSSEFIASCAAHNVRFFIVGGYAIAAHGHPRFTKDLDVWVWLDEQNANRLISALEDFGFGALGLTPSDFLQEGIVVQLGTRRSGSTFGPVMWSASGYGYQSGPMRRQS